MKRRIHSLSLFLAALLQVMPMARTLLTNPSITSTFAIVLRWAIGGVAALGAFDAVSGATTVYYTTPTNYNGTVPNFFTNNATLANTGSDSGAYFVLTNLAGGFSPKLSSAVSTTNCLPPGLTAKCYDVANGGSRLVYLSITGAPTLPVTNFWVHVLAGFKSETPAEENIFFTFLPGGGLAPPNITNNPIGMTNVVGSNATFSVTAGTAPLKYQWYFNTNTILGYGTNASLTLTNIQTTNTGYYSVIITNSGGAATSSPAFLFVAERPGITNQPFSVTNLAGGVASFSVLAGGTPPLKYQWYYNTNSALGNQTNTSVSLTNIRLSQAGTYGVIITNNWGAVTSTPASLVVTMPSAPVVTPLPIVSGNQFQFTFNPISGLTNSVLTNSALVGGSWGVLTNIPPPTNTNSITVTDPITGAQKYYRVLVEP